MWLHVGRYVDRAERFVLEPKHLLILQIVWILPYLFMSNYLERSLLPFRLVCYTEPELLQVQRPVRVDRAECIRYFFPDRQPTQECPLDRRPRHLLRPPRGRFHGIARVMVIRSAPSALAYRSYIRETWKPLVEPSMPVIFVSGTDKRMNMTEEHQEHGDVLQFDFTDSYQNLTMKMMAIYRFFIEETDAEQIVVVNDDTIVNSTALVNVCEEQMSLANSDSQDYIMGKVSRGYPRLFFPWLPWYVSSTVYPHKCYPPFVQGSSFVISRSAAAKILKHICDFPFVHLDDIMMGIVSNCLDIRNVHRDGFDQHTLDKFTVFHYQYARYTTEQMRDSFTLIKHSM
ncbi:Glycosyl transferase, family 31-containing protein [Aphelenchoides besseyi]|nr:Glycosyl transferase, family 31-containing protein [Aphelenchoides besseyi]KAI6232270.1 Glycosyl transferase, family 31-containing protein [Aphelenchoides besseyi]